MQRKHTVKFDGHSYDVSGSFSFGAFDAAKKVLKDHRKKFEVLSGGKHCGVDTEHRTIWKFEAIDHTAGQGLILWVHSN